MTGLTGGFMAEILIVDDERVLREGLKAMLAGEGFAVRTARDGADALKRISEKTPDLVLLDVMMPKMNGFRTCEEIRRNHPTLPVIFLTAKDSETDQVRGIGLGADDYISKDAGEPVLLARINRALARAATFGAPMAERKGHPIRLGKLHVDLNSLSAVGPGGEIIRLSKTEVDILKILDSDRGRFFTLDRIISELRGRGFACEDSLVYVNISRLRRKLGPVGELISCNRSAGYCLLK